MLGFYGRTMRDIVRAGRGQSGAVTVVQRCSSDLRLNPHWHSLVLDGVFVPVDGDKLEFYALRSLSNMAVAELLHTIRARVLAYLEKCGVIESRHEPVLIDDGSAEREPALDLRSRRSACACSRTGWFANADFRMAPWPSTCIRCVCFSVVRA